MADRIINRRAISKPPAQSGTQGNRPQSTHRITRSQSRDISDSDVERKKRNTRGSKTIASVGGDGSATTGAQRKRGFKNHTGAKALQDLPEIEETSRIDDSKSPQRQSASRDQELNPTRRQDGLIANSPDGASTFSGTTARISGSGEGLAGGSAEEMIDALEDLFGASKKVLSLLVPSNISQTSVQGTKERLLDLKSKEIRQLQRYTPNFQAQRAVYGDNRFINPPVIVRATLDIPKVEDVRPGPWRMDPILHGANLASLATFLITQDHNGAEHAWHEVNKLFPRPFLQRFVPDSALGDFTDGSTLLLETFRLAVDLRTRAFIDNAKLLVNEEGFDPGTLLVQAFYEDSDTLSGWNVPGLRFEDVNQNKDFKLSIVARLDQLRRTFSETEAPFIDLERLEEMFPYASLTTSLFRWIHLRLREIELQVQRSGGAGSIVQAIRTVQSTSGKGGQLSMGAMGADFSIRSNPYGHVSHNQQLSDLFQAKAPKATNRSEGRKDLAAFTFGSPKAQPIALTRLKEREASRRSSQQLAASPSTSTRTQPVYVNDTSKPSGIRLVSQVLSGAPPSWQPPVIEEEEHFAMAKLDLGSQVDQIIKTRQMLEVESNKENLPLQEPSQIPDSQPSPNNKRAQFKKPRFLDHQENAERMSWDTQESSFTSTTQSQQPVLDDTPMNEGAEEDSDDQFQTDTRQFTRSQRSSLIKRNIQQAAASRQSPKKPRRSRNIEDVVEPNDIEDPLETHDNDSDPIPSQGERYALVNERAKHQTAIRPKKPQARTPWSEEEIERFLELAEEYGLSWSQLKKMDERHTDGPRLKRRDQVALKDKARNIKYDYLKSGIRVPEYLNGVPLSKIHKQSLAARGIFYESGTED